MRRDGTEQGSDGRAILNGARTIALLGMDMPLSPRTPDLHPTQEFPEKLQR